MSDRDITRLLKLIAKGDQEAKKRLISVVYEDLHRIASSYLRGERPNSMMQTTVLVSEVYLKLFEAPKPLELNDTAHFFAVAATQIRRILVDEARAGAANKRHGVKVELDDACMVAPRRGAELLALDDALRDLEELDEDSAKVVELRYFGGYSHEETAQIMNTNVAKVRRDWEFARAWLYNRLAKA